MANLDTVVLHVLEYIAYSKKTKFYVRFYFDIGGGVNIVDEYTH